MYNGLFTTMAAILVFTTLTTTAFAHVTAQQRYNDGYNAVLNSRYCPVKSPFCITSDLGVGLLIRLRAKSF
ncbi:MAG TPA: hypothetical protein VH500_08525 [Nitrososphaeraceae archaeon]